MTISLKSRWRDLACETVVESGTGASLRFAMRQTLRAPATASAHGGWTRDNVSKKATRRMIRDESGNAGLPVVYFDFFLGLSVR